MSKSNGGFPPIKYCVDKESKKEETNVSTRERYFSSSTKKNINIREILKVSENKPIIDINSNVEELDEVKDF